MPYSSKATAPHGMAVAQCLHLRVQRTADETHAAAVTVCAAHGIAGTHPVVVNILFALFNSAAMQLHTREVH
jgi:NAD/NADP transhydrogenase beta subunit